MSTPTQVTKIHFTVHGLGVIYRSHADFLLTLILRSLGTLSTILLHCFVQLFESLTFDGKLVISIDALSYLKINVGSRTHFCDIKTNDFMDEGYSQQTKLFHHQEVRD